MADEFQEIVEEPTASHGDFEMGDGYENLEEATTGIHVELAFAEGGTEEAKATFVSYLASPVITLLVGQGKRETMVTAHQALLVQSPFFQAACATFAEDGSVSLGVSRSSGSSLLTRLPVVAAPYRSSRR